MILFFPSLVLCFSCCLSLCLVCFNCWGLALHGRCCVPSAGIEVASASLVPTLGEKKKKTFPNRWTHPEFSALDASPLGDWLLFRAHGQLAAKIIIDRVSLKFNHKKIVQRYHPKVGWLTHLNNNISFRRIFIKCVWLCAVSIAKEELSAPSVCVWWFIFPQDRACENFSSRYSSL